MATTEQILAKNGIVENAGALIQAASKVGVPLWIAAAFTEQESGGRNIYGNDAGGTLAGRGYVTQQNYTREFLPAVRGGRVSNGVGPLQITYPGYFKAGQPGVENLWKPLENMIFGLQLIKGYLGGSTSDDAIVRAGRHYNGALPYGYQVLNKAKKWRSLLGSATPSTGSQAPVATSTVLQRGSTGPRVKALQEALLKFFPGYAGPIRTAGGADGIYGASTEAVVKEFQRRSGLTADGIAGPATFSALARMGVRV